MTEGEGKVRKLVFFIYFDEDMTEMSLLYLFKMSKALFMKIYHQIIYLNHNSVKGIR